MVRYSLNIRFQNVTTNVHIKKNLPKTQILPKETDQQLHRITTATHHQLTLSLAPIFTLLSSHPIYFQSQPGITDNQGSRLSHRSTHCANVP